MKQLKAAAVCGLFCIMAGGGAVAAEKDLKTIPVGDDAKEALTSDTRLVYTSADLSYFHADLKEADTNGDDLGEDGFGVSGSFLLLPNIFLVASYQMAETDELTGLGQPIETSRIDLGAGYRYGLSSTLDLVGTLRAVQLEAEVQGLGKDDDTGFQVAAGARWLVIDQVEVAGNVSYLDIAEDGDVSVNLSGLYHIIPLISAGLNVGFGDKYGEQATSYGATVRFNFQ